MAKHEVEEEIIQTEEEEDGIARITAFSPRFEKMLIACIFVMALAIVVAVLGMGAMFYYKMTHKKEPALTVQTQPEEKIPAPLPATEKAKITNDAPVILSYPKLPGEGLRYALSLPDGGIGVVVTRNVPAVPGKSIAGTEERILVWYPDQGRVLRELRMSPPSESAPH
ncbi:histidine kinase [Lasius niger]|uniref:Histidine kinase n=1 Tax=Lasius niger TaxID=67767 RepID=A0A0J7KF61_LASNI|nr:histidine kinase [Lasius niger]